MPDVSLLKLGPKFIILDKDGFKRRKMDFKDGFNCLRSSSEGVRISFFEF